MKIQYNIPALLLFAMALTSSCEKTIDVNTPPYERKLALNSSTETNQQLFVFIGTTAAIKEQRSQPDLIIKNAEVQLYVDDVFAEQLHFDNMWGYPSSITAQPGKKYTLKVSAPTYGNAEASAVAPSTVSLTSVERVPHARKMDGQYQDAVIIRFNDPAAAGDFYIVRMYGPQDSFIFSNDFCVFSSDASIETGAAELGDVNTCLRNMGIYFRDALFNGQQKELKFYANSDMLQPVFNGTDSIYSHIELQHVPEAYFRFGKSSQIANDANGNPFAEPVNVYSNVTNGLGIFSIVSTDMREIR